MRELLLKKVGQQIGACFYCGGIFKDMAEVEPDHREPRGMNGSRRCDREQNIVAACHGCNREKGSKRL
jgi:hypothetical protein